MEINIPFNAWSLERIRLGKKFATTRRHKYGFKNDCFKIFGKTYKIEIVVKLPLWFISKYLYNTEGAETPLEFWKVWCDIHPKGQIENMMNWECYYHFFESVSYEDFIILKNGKDVETLHNTLENVLGE